MPTVDQINAFCADYKMFHDILGKVTDGISEAAEVSLFQTLLKDIRDRECAAVRGGGFRKPASGGHSAGASGNGGGASGAPSCPVHHKPMRPSRDGGWYCPCKTPEGTYCDQKA